MNSDIDLPHGQDVLQEPSQMKKKRNSIWKAVFISLLILNLGVGHWVLSVIDYGRGYGLGSFAVVVLALLILAPIDLIVVLLYIRKQQPYGKARTISYTALIPIVLAIMYVIYVFLS